MKKINAVPVADKPLLIDAKIPAALGAQLITLRNLALALAREVEALEPEAGPTLKDGIRIQSILRQYEIKLIRQALRITNGHQLRAARLLGLKTTTLNSKLKRYDIKV